MDVPRSLLKVQLVLLALYQMHLSVSARSSALAHGLLNLDHTLHLTETVWTTQCGTHFTLLDSGYVLHNNFKKVIFVLWSKSISFLLSQAEFKHWKIFFFEFQMKLSHDFESSWDYLFTTDLFLVLFFYQCQAWLNKRHNCHKSDFRPL